MTDEPCENGALIGAERRKMNAQEAMDTIKTWMRALKHVKDESGRSWKSIADEAGVRKKTLIVWAEGVSFPNLVTFMTFLDALGYEIKIVRKGNNGQRQREKDDTSGAD